MIDYILHFSSLAAAKADPQVQNHYDQLADAFAADRVIPGLQVWRASQDVTNPADGSVTHTYLTGWYCLISLNNVIPALRDYSATQLVIDRDKANARQPGTIVAKQISNALLLDIRFQPVFAGADYPFGGFN